MTIACPKQATVAETGRVFIGMAACSAGDK